MTANGSGARLQELGEKGGALRALGMDLSAGELSEFYALKAANGAANDPAAWRGFARPVTLEVFVPVRCRRPDGKFMWPSDWLFDRGFDTAEYTCEFVGEAGSRVIAGRVTL